MNIKKLFALLAGVSMVAQTVVPSTGVFAATYSQELQDAYNWAYSKEITTMSPIDNANMYGNITRAELAKMLSNWAMNVKGLTPDTSAVCNFTDTDSVKGDLHDFITTSCQLGLMGQGITAFRPYDSITRAEFGTALSRALWGDENNGGTPYYAKHLNALKEAGIMTQIDNADSRKEIRGYVMLMLMRTEGTSICDDVVVKVTCAAEAVDGNYKDCPTACRNDGSNTDEVVKSGDLAITATSNNGKAILSKGVSDMDTLKIKTSEDVAVSKIVLERYGYSTNENVDRLRLEDENGVIISSIADSLNSKWQATLTLKKDYKVVDGTLNATIVIDANAKAGNTIWFKVVDVTSSAANVNLDDYNPYTYSVVEYDGADLILTVRGSTKTYNYEAGKYYEVAKFKLKAPSDSAINVRSFTLTDGEKNEIEYDENIEDVKVTVAGKEVSSSWNVNKDDELVINLSNVELAAKDNSEFVVSIKLSNDFDKMSKSVNFYIKESSDISATDSKTSSRVLVKALATDANGDHLKYEWDKTEWPTYTFQGGKVKITSENLGNVEASEDSSDIVIAKWEITTSQTIKADKWDITVSVTNNNDPVVTAMRLEIAGDTYEGTAVKDNNGVITSFSFPSIDVDHSGKIRILVDTVEDGNENDYATFKISGFENFYYEDSKTDADVAGSLNVSRLTLTPSKASLTNKKSSDEVEFKAGESSVEKTIFEGTYTSKKKDINLNKFTLTWDGTWDEDNKMTVYLYIDGEPVADSKFSSNKASDTFSNVLVEAEKSVSIELKAQVDAAENKLVNAAKFTLTLEGEDENWNPKSGVASKSTAKVSVVKKWTPEVEVNVAQNTVLRRWDTDALAEFIVKPFGGSSIDIETIRFKKPAWDLTCDQYKVVVDTDETPVEKTYNSVKYCEVEGLAVPVNSEGINVKIELEDEVPYDTTLTEITIENIYVNDTEVTDKFNKAYADALIKFTQSWDGKSNTTFKVAEVKWYSASTKITDIHFYADEAMTKEFLINDLGENENLTVGKEFTIKNDCTDHRVMVIKYTVKRTGVNDQIVTVKHSKYGDYFKTTGWDKLTVYDNGKDSWQECGTGYVWAN